MQKPEQNFEDIEKALSRLMPVAVSENAQARMNEVLDGLAGDAEVIQITRFDLGKPAKWLTISGIAAAFGVGAYLSIWPKADTVKAAGVVSVSNSIESQSELVYLSESDRVEGVSDEGLFVDSGGSAVRKFRIRMIEESQIRDEETGIVVMLTEPREETYMVPVSTF